MRLTALTRQVKLLSLLANRNNFLLLLQIYHGRDMRDDVRILDETTELDNRLDRLITHHRLVEAL